MNEQANEGHSAMPSRYAIRVADLSPGLAREIDLRAEPGETERLRRELDLDGLRKLRLRGRLSPLGKRDWQFEGKLGATVVQPCVATLVPVTTRIDTDVRRQFLSDFDMPDAPEAEMPEDDTTEPLGAVIDPWQILSEALVLALPLYPRAQDAAPVKIAVTEPGQQPMTDEQARPFAGLADLRDALKDKND